MSSLSNSVPCTETFSVDPIWRHFIRARCFLYLQNNRAQVSRWGIFVKSVYKKRARLLRHSVDIHVIYYAKCGIRLEIFKHVNTKRKAKFIL